MNVPFHRPYIGEEEIDAVVDSLRNGWITMGKKTSEFENRFQEYIAAKNAVALNSATAALHLALAVVGLKEGDEVIVPTMTFNASSLVARYFKATPVLVDIEKDTHLMDVSRLEEKITKKTKVIMPVHYAGQPCDMDEILEIAAKYNLYVIEDAAHSLPAWYKGQKIGNIGDITCFSFYATKTLATGEGGMATTDNDDWATQMKILRRHGINQDQWKRFSDEEPGSWGYDVLEMGYKYNTTDINAAMGIEQLKKLESMWHLRRAIAAQYDNAFKEVEELITYTNRQDRISAHHLYPLKLNLETLSIDRSRFIQQLKEKRIGVSVHFIPIYRFQYYKGMYDIKDFPNTEWVFQRIISLPIFPGMTQGEIDYVSENVIRIAKENQR